MWEIDNKTPFPHVGTFIRDAAGRSLWCVGVKATFEFRNDRPCLFTADQILPHQGPVFDGDDPSRDMLADMDMGPPKDRVDVLADAVAYPPAGSGDEPFDARLSVGPMTKAIQVNPPTRWSRWLGAVTDDAQPVTPVPLRYSSAFGGAEHPENPVGFGASGSLGAVAGDPVPRLSLPGQPVQSPKRPVPPAALAPIPRQWPQRNALSGTYDEAWQRRRAPLLPEDLDPGYWQAAPADQQLDRALAPGARVALVNLISEDGRHAAPPVSFDLPDLRMTIATRFRGKWEQMVPDLQTVHLFTEARRLSLFYLSTIPIEAAQNDVFVERTVISLDRGSGLRVRPEDAGLFSGDNIAEETA